MPLDTNLNVSPYYDDYNEDKNFHRILFRPGLAVQARELTQLQTILQNQVERFGDNVFKVGTIIKGCTLAVDANYSYIKIRDLQNNGAPVNLNLYSNTLAVQESINLQSIVVNSLVGFESTNPDLNTIYIKYQNTGTGGEKAFANGQVIKIFNRSRTIESVAVNNGGSGYTNGSSVVTFTGGGGTGASALITTDASGVITDVSMVSKGSGYTSAPTVAVSGGSSANLTALNYIAEVVVANSAFTAPVGKGVAVINSEGVIYQKGHFIRVDRNETVIEKYSVQPNNVVVGFLTQESIVNSSSDSTLLDNAAGSPNFAAPGANRLKLTPSLISLTKTQAAANSDFLALLEFEDGNVVRDRTTTQYNYIGRELNKRTFEESGNYVLNTLILDTTDRFVNSSVSNTTHFDLKVGSGVAYVNGERVELLNSVRVPVRKGSNTNVANNTTINTNYGNYVVVKELHGIFEIKEGTEVLLRDQPATDISDNAGGTPTASGDIIGNAKVRALEYASGTPGTPTATYKIYLFDIRMLPNKSFRQTRSLNIANQATADIVLGATSNAELKDASSDTFVFYAGAPAVKELTREDFIFRTSTNNALTSTGNTTISFSDGNTLPYGTTSASGLTNAIKENIIVIPTTTFRLSSNAAGTVSANTTAVTVTGTSTTFTTSFEVGDFIIISNGTETSTPQRISKIINDNSLELSANFVGISGATANAVANGIFKAFPANVPIDFTQPNRIISVPSNTNLTVELGASINVSSADITVYHDMRNFEPSLRTKTLNNPVYIKLSTDTFQLNTTGPWCLGIPDVLSIEAVYVGTGNTYSEDVTNSVSDFELDNGQKDNLYGLAYLKRAPGSNISLGSTNCLLVKLKCFVHTTTGKYISTEAYPVDDATVPLPNNKIRTEDIPVFVSPTSGLAYPLSDSVDFRPIVANTATRSSTAAGASIDPSSTETLVAGEKYFPSPSTAFECDVEHYLNRIDRIVLDATGTTRIVEGTPSNSPSAPSRVAGTMDLGLIYVRPFPSLTAKRAAQVNRPDIRNSIVPLQTKRYTMSDIGNIESRIQRLEYFSLLNTLEANTKSITILDESGTSEVFKNGFFVDPFNGYAASNLNDGEYKAYVDANRSILLPQLETNVIDLKYNPSSSTNVTKSGALVTLNYTEKTMLDQPIANKIRTLTELYWNFNGTMSVVPKVDNYFDSTVTSTSAIDINIADPLNSLIDAQNEINRQISHTTTLIDRVVDTQLVSNITTNAGNWFTNTRTFDETTTSTFNDSWLQISNLPVVTTTQSVNNLLTSATINPYVRAQKIGIVITGLRPGAQHYVYFDKVDVTAQCSPATVTGSGELTVNDFTPVNNRLSTAGLYASNTGTLVAILDLPGNTFITGRNDILVMDIPDINSESSATSKSVGTFVSFGILGNATNITFSTSTFDTSSSGFSVNTFDRTRVEIDERQWETSVSWAVDPLCQSFIIPKQEGGEVVYLTSVELYFRNKDAVNGVTVELRETNKSGYPTTKSLPYSRVHLTSAQVTTSENASNATKFTFTSPVMVTTGEEYALVIIPDANSPDYRIWTAETGIPDVFNTNLISNQSWGLGTLFYSTSNRAFSPVQNEDIKFKLNKAIFSPTSGYAVLNNSDYEFLTVNTMNGVFRGGELVSQLANTYLNASLTTDSTNTTILTSASLTSALSAGDYITLIYDINSTAKTGTVTTSGNSVSNGTSSTTAFNTDYQRGSFFRIGSEIRQVVNVNSSSSMTIDFPFPTSIVDQNHSLAQQKFDVLKVLSTTSATIVVDRPPAYTSNNTVAVVAQKTPAGKVQYYNATTGKLYIKDSTASSASFLFKTPNPSNLFLGHIIGDESEASANVVTIDNIPSPIFTSLINSITLPATTVNFTATITKLGGGTSTDSYAIVGKNFVNIDDTAIIKSKSNEITQDSGAKSFSANLSLSSAFSDTSPVIDVQPSSIATIKYNINNSDTDENTRYGNAAAKYISKKMILKDGLEAEDARVYLRGYRPSGTDFKVYAKIINSADGESFNNKDWSELDMVTAAGLYSSALDENDLKEYEFTFKRTPTASELPGRVSITGASNSSINGSGTQFTASFNANSDVNGTTNFISITSNKYRDNDVVKYAVPAGNTAISGLVPNKEYYVVNSSSSGVKLALTANGSPVDISGKSGSEAGHKLSIISPGDIVKIINTSATADYDIRAVNAVSSATALVLESNTSFGNASGLVIEKVTKPREAFKNNKNNFIVTYFDSNNAAHNTYKTIAIKIVLKSDKQYRAPHVDDVRVIATSV